MAQEPPYQPNVVNQTVSYGGATWKGNPGTGWTMEGGGGYGAPDYAAIAQQQLKMQQEANQPAVASLQASIPETQQKFATERTRLEGEKAPLEQKYQALIADIKGTQAEEEQRTGITTAQELGRRGISAESGLYGQTVNKALAPVSRFYTGQATQAGLGQMEYMRGLQNLISGLTPQEVESQRQIQNAIASLQSGGAQNAIQQALGIYNAQQAAQQNAAEMALRQRLADQEATSQSAQLAYQQKRQPLELDLLKAQVASAQNKGAGGAVLTAEDFMRQFGGQPSQKQSFTVPSYFTTTPPVNIYKGMPGLTFS